MSLLMLRSYLRIWTTQWKSMVLHVVSTATIMFLGHFLYNSINFYIDTINDFQLRSTGFFSVSPDQKETEDMILSSVKKIPGVSRVERIEGEASSEIKKWEQELIGIVDTKKLTWPQYYKFEFNSQNFSDQAFKKVPFLSDVVLPEGGPHQIGYWQKNSRMILYLLVTLLVFLVMVLQLSQQASLGKEFSRLRLKLNSLGAHPRWFFLSSLIVIGFEVLMIGLLAAVLFLLTEDILMVFTRKVNLALGVGTQQGWLWSYSFLLTALLSLVAFRVVHTLIQTFEK